MDTITTLVGICTGDSSVKSSRYNLAVTGVEVCMYLHIQPLTLVLNWKVMGQGRSYFLLRPDVYVLAVLRASYVNYYWPRNLSITRTLELLIRGSLVDLFSFLEKKVDHQCYQSVQVQYFLKSPSSLPLFTQPRHLYLKLGVLEFILDLSSFHNSFE